MSDITTDSQIEDERAKLEEFAAEVRRFFDQLAQEVEADFSRLVARLTEQQQQLIDQQGDALLSEAASLSLASRVEDGLGQIAIQNQGDSVIGRALQASLGAVISGGVRRGQVRPRTILRRVAGVFGAQLGQDLAGVLGMEAPEDTFRLSRNQSAREQAGSLQRSVRIR
jgi:hypothetical protein